MIHTLPNPENTQSIKELISVLRDARNACRRRRSACQETGHPGERMYYLISVDLDSILYRLSRYAYT